MAITALDLHKTRAWTYSKDTDDPTVFKIAQLSSRDVGRIRDGVTTFEVPNKAVEGEGSTKTTINKSKLTFEACRRGLKGFENLRDADGNPVQFEDHQREIDGTQRRVVKDHILDLIPIEVLEEMADAIMGTSEVEEGEVGNSQEPSSDG